MKIPPKSKHRLKTPASIVAAITLAVRTNSEPGAERWLLLMSIEEAIDALGGKCPQPADTEGSWDRSAVEPFLFEALAQVTATQEALRRGQPCNHGWPAVEQLLKAFETAGAAFTAPVYAS